MAETINTLLTEKLEENWNTRNTIKNFAEDKELTVTITLAEYRQLISETAKSQLMIDKANNDKCDRETKITKLTNKVKELEEELVQYRIKYGLIDNDESEEE